MAVGAAALASVIFAVINLGREGADVLTLAAGAAAALSAVGFVLVERHAREPVLPVCLWTSRPFVGANAVAGAMNFVGIGVGMGFLTAAVVAAAMRATPADRLGLGTSVNNAARQSAGALGVAVYGTITGAPRTMPRSWPGYMWQD